MLLYVGNKLTGQGKTPTSADIMPQRFEEFMEVQSTSDKKNIFYRMIDMVITLISNANKIEIILIDAYSTKNFYYLFIISFFAKLFKIPYIPILRGGDLNKRLVNNRILSNYIFSSAAINVAPSNFLFELFKEYDFKVEYVPNTIDIKLYPQKVISDVKMNILFVRAFAKLYNPQLAIHVLKELQKTHPAAKLCMVGPDKDGSLATCKELVIKLDLINDVTFTGKLLKEEWIALADGYDIFINPTNFDNMPVSVMEAMALGMLVVSTNVGGLSFLVDDHVNGLLVEKENIIKMTEAILELEDKNLVKCLSVNARKKAQALDWNVIKDDWKLIIEKYKKNKKEH